ncbi:hypothetical protein K9M48_01725 [Candidatus Gracilibacteria bacterium]|nr:hypothetical protein [Candidatus Gracilibacteria bacterium]
MEVTYGFSKGLLNENQVQICDQDMGDNNEFSKLFKNSNGNRTFTLDSGKPITIKEKINIPLGMEGMIYGCLAYKATAVGPKAGGVFDIVIRKAVHLNLFIGGDYEIRSSIALLKNKSDIFSSNNKIKAEVIDNELILSLIAENNSNIAQKISMNGKIYNALGFQQKFEIPEKKLIPNSSEEFTVNVGILPFYKGPFNVSIDIQGIPSFDFDTSNIDPSLKEPITIQESGKIFIFTRIWILIAILIILILVLILRPLFRKHHDQV